MEEFIDQLRDNAIYIKLKSGKKFGGAVDINSLVKALNSLNQSYKSFLEIGVLQSPGLKITTKKSKKELQDFVSESELLIVDLDFASFGAAICPNTITGSVFNSIPDNLKLKKKAFKSYREEVLDVDYTNKTQISDILSKYSVEERNEIYKPVITNLIGSPNFQFYYGSDKKKLKKMSRGIPKEIVESLVPKISKPVGAPDEEMYVMYVTSSDEVDLFGKKPKFSKVLATSKLDKPVYPYQINEIKVDSSLLSFKEKLSAEVNFDDNMYFIVYPDLNIEVWGDDRQEAEIAFNFALKSIIRNFYFEENAKLTKKALQLKKHIERLIKSSTG